MKFRLLPFLFFLTSISCGNEKKSVPNQQTETNSKPLEMNEPRKKILFLGNSITAGYGLDPDFAFPSILAQKIDSGGYKYEVQNAGLSGETTAGGVSRLEWLIQQPFEIMVLELGANDALRGLPIDQSKVNLQSMITTVKSTNPGCKIILAGMEAPPNMGAEYATKFREMFAQLADYNQIEYIPFLLENVAGIQSLNQADGIHPTERGHQKVATLVWKYLEPLLDS